MAGGSPRQYDGGELSMALQHFEKATTASRESRAVKALDPLSFALQLLSPPNDAVAPVQEGGATTNLNCPDLQEPLARLWTATSHNSCTAMTLEPTQPALCTSHRVTLTRTAAGLEPRFLAGQLSPVTCVLEWPGSRVYFEAGNPSLAPCCAPRPGRLVPAICAFKYFARRARGDQRH